MRMNYFFLSHNSQQYKSHHSRSALPTWQSNHYRHQYHQHQFVRFDTADNDHFTAPISTLWSNDMWIMSRQFWTGLAWVWSIEPNQIIVATKAVQSDLWFCISRPRPIIPLVWFGPTVLYLVVELIVQLKSDSTTPNDSQVYFFHEFNWSVALYAVVPVTTVTPSENSFIRTFL